MDIVGEGEANSPSLCEKKENLLSEMNLVSLGNDGILVLGTIISATTSFPFAFG